MAENPLQPPDDPEFPAGLRDRLAAAARVNLPIPKALDAAILAHARLGYARRMRFRRTVRWISLAASAAAILIVALFIVDRYPDRSPQFVRQTIEDGPSSRISMLDAFNLARRLKANDTIGPAWDVNRDGIVDDKDVAALARIAVSLDNAGSTGDLAR